MAKEARAKQDQQDELRRQRRLAAISAKADTTCAAKTIIRQRKQKNKQPTFQNPQRMLTRRTSEIIMDNNQRMIKIARYSEEQQPNYSEDVQQTLTSLAISNGQEANSNRSQIHESALQVRAKRRNIDLVNTHLLATSDHTEPHYLGRMNIKCNFCFALHFAEEKLSNKKFSDCCKKGEVIIPSASPYPHLLKMLMTKQHVHSKNFMANIRIYNSAMSFASIGANIDFPPGRGPYCFRIHGQMYHKISNINTGSAAKFGQLYFLESADA